MTKKISKVVKSDKKGLRVWIKPTRTTVRIRLNGKPLTPNMFGLKKKSLSHTDFKRMVVTMNEVKEIIDTFEVEKLEDKIKKNGGFLLNGEYDPESVGLIPYDVMAKLDSFPQFLMLLDADSKREEFLTQ